MKKSYLLFGAFGILFGACPPAEPPGPSGFGSFSSDQNLNNVDASTATTSIFGVSKTDNNNDGVFDQTVLEIFTSSQADICTRVANGEFVDAFTFPEGTHVDLFAVLQSDFTGGAITGNNAFILSAAILAQSGGTNQLVAASAFATPQVTINLDTFDLEAGAIGSLDATLEEDATLDPVNPGVINVALTGTFEATHCQALSDLLSQ